MIPKMPKRTRAIRKINRLMLIATSRRIWMNLLRLWVIKEAAWIQDIADRVNCWLKEGIPKTERMEIVKLVPTKYKNIDINASKWNDEIKCNLKEEAVKRDKYFYSYQNLIGSGLSLTGAALSMLLNDKKEPVDRDVMLQLLSDAVKMNADLFHSWIIVRKAYITPSFDKKIKSVLDKAEPTEFLFGDNVKELIKNVKVIERIGKDLKATTNKRTFRPNNSVNWRGSSGKREGIR
ncbi:uncharacterized protein LOC113464850 isoform X1 [Ceratina calcarata]|uniref:Uncharacterized protein LOC113464850 isoform X1 n=1 Tax=Ceratina calcarata TaxID=156304 RepID=A0AAJ7WE74_9HYME|nr:uncharacterized protein LOC113464850 isoform X1 [Ceratina calcarata]